MKKLNENWKIEKTHRNSKGKEMANTRVLRNKHTKSWKWRLERDIKNGKIEIEFETIYETHKPFSLGCELVYITSVFTFLFIYARRAMVEGWWLAGFYWELDKQNKVGIRCQRLTFHFWMFFDWSLFIVDLKKIVYLCNFFTILKFIMKPGVVGACDLLKRAELKVGGMVQAWCQCSWTAR